MEFKTGQAEGISMQDAFSNLSLAERVITDITEAVRGKDSTEYIKRIQPKMKEHQCVCICTKPPVWEGIYTKKQMFPNKGTRKWKKWYCVYKEDGGLVDKKEQQADAVKAAEDYTRSNGVSTYVDYEDQLMEGVKTVCIITGTRPAEPVERGNYWFMWLE